MRDELQQLRHLRNTKQQWETQLQQKQAQLESLEKDLKNRKEQLDRLEKQLEQRESELETSTPKQLQLTSQIKQNTMHTIAVELLPGTNFKHQILFRNISTVLRNVSSLFASLSPCSPLRQPLLSALFRNVDRNIAQSLTQCSNMTI